MKDGGAAFPAPNYLVPQDLAEKDVSRLGETRGMSLRDYFAAKAMQGLAQGWVSKRVEFSSPMAESMADAAYVFADEMLAARERD